MNEFAEWRVTVKHSNPKTGQLHRDPLSAMAVVGKERNPVAGPQVARSVDNPDVGVVVPPV